jgi:hypothetical protein
VAYVEFEERHLSLEEKAARTGGWEDELNAYLMVVTPRGGAPRRIGPFEGLQLPFEGRPFGWARDSHSLVYAYDEMVETPDHCAEEKSRREHEGGATVPDYRMNISVRTLSVSSGQRVELALLAPTGGTTDVFPFDPDVVFSPSEKAVALVACRWAASEWHRDIAVLPFAGSRLRFVTAFPDATGRRVAGFGELAWHGDRIYFTCENPGVRVAPSALPAQGSREAREIWSVREDGKDLRQETSGPDDHYPAPRPGGKDLAFLRDGSVCLREADGSVRTLVEGRHGDAQPGHCVGPMSWSPDGREIAFTWVGIIGWRSTIWAARVLPAGRDAVP